MRKLVMGGALALGALVGGAVAQPAPETQRQVVFTVEGRALHGCLSLPADHARRLPVMIYNHGSEKDPQPCGPPALAKAYLEHGYAFFAFQRHGHGQSQGDYIVDLEQAARAKDGAAWRARSVALHELYNRDVEGAVAYVRTRPEVDPKRVVMTGVSYGGIQTLLAAEKGMGVKAFVVFAPGAMSWGNPELRKRLVRAAEGAKAPVFLAQAANDYSTGPSETLGPIVRRKGPPSDAKLYPAFGTTNQQGHGGFAVRGGVPIWSPDVFAFLDRALKGAG